jgi:hypothetical protein
MRAMKVSARTGRPEPMRVAASKVFAPNSALSATQPRLGWWAGPTSRSPISYVTLRLRVGGNEEAACAAVRHRRIALLSAQVPSLIVEDDGKRLRLRASLP